ncbi:hypothetical protein EKI59_01180 [Corynebacterium sanguinis]|uniref:Type ISP restriction-modification enzyme LLaBIII C-terminal specificity domain-containing protein n=1 Tax=Corynebacterium sanguinis TaxID=2594913 RepID=A0A6C1U091_9CORY|nr:hypothetical protein EKI59_01180 [Corynebacterium sanguinis]
MPAKSPVCAWTRSDSTRLPGCINDSDAWADEVGNPRYIIDLIGKVTRVAVETVRIVNSIDSRKQA